MAGLAITRADLVDGYELVVELSEANGLREGDSVLVAGVEQGEVQQLRIVDDRVEATLLVEGAELGSDATARVEVQTLVGMRGVALEAGSDFDDPLDDGDRIPLERTSTTTDVPEFGDEADALLSEVDSEALNAFVGALDDIVRGQREEVADLVDGGTVGMTDAVGLYPGEISGGMKKRAGLARGMVLEPEILLFDEPDSGLDPVRTAYLNELILTLKSQLDSTFVVVTHHIPTAKNISDHLALLFRRNLIMAGPKEALLDSDEPVVRQFLRGSTHGPIGMSEEKDRADPTAAYDDASEVTLEDRRDDEALPSS